MNRKIYLVLFVFIATVMSLQAQTVKLHPMFLNDWVEEDYRDSLKDKMLSDLEITKDVPFIVIQVSGSEDNKLILKQKNDSLEASYKIISPYVIDVDPVGKEEGFKIILNGRNLMVRTAEKDYYYLPAPKIKRNEEE